MRLLLLYFFLKKVSSPFISFYLYLDFFVSLSYVLVITSQEFLFLIHDKYLSFFFVCSWPYFSRVLPLPDISFSYSSFLSSQCLCMYTPSLMFKPGHITSYFLYEISLCQLFYFLGFIQLVGKMKDIQ